VVRRSLLLCHVVQTQRKTSYVLDSSRRPSILKSIYKYFSSLHCLEVGADICVEHGFFILKVRFQQFGEFVIGKTTRKKCVFKKKNQIFFLLKIIRFFYIKFQ
jgi:hypothetical protein